MYSLKHFLLKANLWLSASILSLFTGCAWIGDRSAEYMRAEEGQALSIPAGLENERLRTAYPIPDIENQKQLSGKFVVPQPPDATAAIIAEPYLIESMLDETWVQVFSAPSEVWPMIKLFFDRYGLDLLIEDTSKGFILSSKIRTTQSNLRLVNALEETEYAPLVVSGMQFQVLLRPGVRRNTTEVQVRALLSQLVDQDETRWSNQAFNAKAELGLMELLGRFVSSEDAVTRHSFKATELGGGSRVSLTESDTGESVLSLRLSQLRALAELQQALDAAGVIYSKDSESGQLYVAYLDQDEMESWYHTDSMLEEKRLERNIELRLESLSGRVDVHAYKLSEEIEDETLSDLLAIIYEHLS